jgi:hypothetical protein
LTDDSHTPTPKKNESGRELEKGTFLLLHSLGNLDTGAQTRTHTGSQTQLGTEPRGRTVGIGRTRRRHVRTAADRGPLRRSLSPRSGRALSTPWPWPWMLPLNGRPCKQQILNPPSAPDKHFALQCAPDRKSEFGGYLAVRLIECATVHAAWRWIFFFSGLSLNWPRTTPQLQVGVKVK